MKDEESTTMPTERSRWKHNETSNDYIVLGEQKAKLDGRWYDGIAYEEFGSTGKRYWRTVQDFHRNFSEVTQNA